MTYIAVVHHSGFGHTARQAEAVIRGVTSFSEVTCEGFDVGQTPYPFEALAAADAIVFGSLFLVLLIKPTGLFGKATTLARVTRR